MITTVVFDADQTLVDTNSAVSAALKVVVVESPGALAVLT